MFWWESIKASNVRKFNSRAFIMSINNWNSLSERNLLNYSLLISIRKELIWPLVSSIHTIFFIAAGRTFAAWSQGKKKCLKFVIKETVTFVDMRSTQKSLQFLTLDICIFRRNGKPNSYFACTLFSTLLWIGNVVRSGFFFSDVFCAVYAVVVVFFVAFSASFCTAFSFFSASSSVSFVFHVFYYKLASIACLSVLPLFCGFSASCTAFCTLLAGICRPV